jgi:autotransporter-associated beta strand protein
MKSNRSALLTLIIALGLFAAANSRAATHIWTGGGSSEFWNNPANWTGGVPLIGEAAPITLIFTNGVTTTNNIPGLVVDSLQFLGDNAAVYGSSGGTLTIRGNGGTNLWFKGTLNELTETLPVAFTGSNYCVVANGAFANLHSSLGGSGDVTWDGGGRMTFYGSSANTCSGTTRVLAISLKLSKSAGVNAIAGPLILDQGPGGVTYNVELLAADQILDSVPVTIYSGNALLALSFNEKLNDLNLYGGTFNLVNGLLTLGGNVDATGTAIINNPVSLGGATRTINVSGGGLLTLPKLVTNGVAAAGITKTGPGTLKLAGTNNFTGAVTVSEGTLELANDSALGTTAGGLTVQSSATLKLSSANIGAEALTLNGTLSAQGTNSWAGAVNVASETLLNIPFAAQTTLSGAVSGAGSLTKTGLGVLVFSGTQGNTHSGGVQVSAGTLSLNKTGVSAALGPLTLDSGGTVRYQAANQLGNSSAVTVNSGGTLDLNGFSDTIGSLAGSGAVNLGSATLTTGGNNGSTTFSGIIGGNGIAPILKVGSGTFVLSGSNTCTGASQVNAGTLEVNGSLPGPVTVTGGGGVSGGGRVGNLASGSGNISPGADFGIGKLTVADLALTNSLVQAVFDLAGPTPGSGHDQIVVNGTVTLNNPLLTLLPWSAGGLGNQYVLIANDGADVVTGTFNGLPEGATITVGLQQYTISYHGGTGNDVVLTQTGVPPSPQITAITKGPGGVTQLLGTGLASTLYYVEATATLSPANWQPLDTVTSSAGGAISYTDTAAPNYAQRFYRLRLP